MESSPGGAIRFDDFVLDIGAAELRRKGEAVSVEPQVFDLIRLLVENAGRVVSRDDIIEHVWGGRVISDTAISTRINAARRALGDDGKTQRYVKTIQRRGFRFEAQPQRVGGEEAAGRADTSPARGGPEAPPLPDRPSIVVLPFKDLTGRADQAHLADGLRIDIQNALVKVSGAFIIAAGSASAFRGASSQQAARALGVRYALEGSVRSAGNRLRFSAQLTDAVGGRIVWSEQFDRTMEDSFELLDEITGRVLTAMNVALVAGEPAKVWHKTLKNLKSLEAFYRGVSAFFQMSRESLSAARRHFETVCERHPESAIGPTWLALTHWYDFQRGWAERPERSQELARQWAEKAVSLADADGQAHTVLSHVYLLERRFDEALEAGRGAIANRPNCAHANGFYANVLHYCGEQDSALHHIGLAMRYSPIHPPLFKTILAAASHAAGDRDGAAAAAADAIGQKPDDVPARLILASVEMRRHHPQRAAELADEIKRTNPEFSVAAYAEREPYRSDEFLNSLVSDLRAAGLPD